MPKTANSNQPPSTAASEFKEEELKSPQGSGDEFSAALSQMNFKDKIMIHVVDDAKNLKRDFLFSRSLLIRHMKYFERCLKNISEQDEIDISIHCDASIFEWLLHYILRKE